MKIRYTFACELAEEDIEEIIEHMGYADLEGYCREIQRSISSGESPPSDWYWLIEECGVGVSVEVSE